MQHFDLASGDFATGLLDGEAHAVELALAQHREHARSRHQYANLQGVGRERRGQGLCRNDCGESADGD